MGKNFDVLNKALKEPIILEFYNLKDVRDIITFYIRDNALEEKAKKGHVTLDP